METKTLSAALLLACCAVVFGLPKTKGAPSVDPPLLYPAGVRRSVDPSDSDEMPDDASAPVNPQLVPVFPMKPFVDPSQFIAMKAQIKADLLKNLFGPGGIKYPSLAVRSPKPPPPPPPKSGAGKYGPPGKGAAAKPWAAKAAAAAAARPAPPPEERPEMSPWAFPPRAPAAPAAPRAPEAPMMPQAPMPAAIPLAPASPYAWTSINAPPPSPSDLSDKKSALMEALLAQMLADESAPRFAREPIGAAPAAPAGPSPYLSELLDSLNLTLPELPPTLKPTIEPPGFWFPSVIATPGGAKPFAVDPTSIIAKKSKFLQDLFASKAAAAVTPPPLPSDPALGTAEYSTKVSSYLDQLADSVNSKRALESEHDMPEDEMMGMRKKRAIDDDSDDDATDMAAKKAQALATISGDMDNVKNNILVQLEAMSQAQSQTVKAQKSAAKAAKAKITPLSTLMVPPATIAPPAVPVEDFQQRIVLLTNIYDTLAGLKANITADGAPAAPGADLTNPDKLFIAAVNNKMSGIVSKNLKAKTKATTKTLMARSSGWQNRWRNQQESSDSNPQQFEADGETNRRQKSAVPLVAAVFAPETHHHHQSRQPYWWN